MRFSSSCIVRSSDGGGEELNGKLSFEQKELSELLASSIIHDHDQEINLCNENFYGLSVPPYFACNSVGSTSKSKHCLLM